jgi:hypothetical protein
MQAGIVVYVAANVITQPVAVVPSTTRPSMSEPVIVGEPVPHDVSDGAAPPTTEMWPPPSVIPELKVCDAENTLIPENVFVFVNVIALSTSPLFIAIIRQRSDVPS